MLAQVGHKLKTFLPLPLPPEDHDCKVVMTATPCLVVCVDYAVESIFDDRMSQGTKHLNQGRKMKN